MTQGLAVDAAVLAEFRNGLRGDLVLPEDTEYDAARALYNAMIDLHPGAIVRCAGVADVIQAVNFARENQLEVSVRGGGHNVAGNALCENGLVIDVSRMRSVRVDPVARTARAEAGCTYADLDHECQAFGLATTGGTISDTGIAGLTLGGGVGWLMRKHGMACDNVRAVDLVTADGRFIQASAAENEDLYWGIRGGGGNFGVVTSFEYQLHPVGPLVLGGMVVHPMERAREVLRFYRDFTHKAPDELTAFLGLLTSPEGLPVVAILVCYNGDLAAGEVALRDLRSFGPPLADLIQPMPYRAVQGMLDAGFGRGFQNYWKGRFIKGLTDDAIDVIAEYGANRTSPFSAALLEHFGGAVGRVDKAATAFEQRDGAFELLIVARWTDPAEAEPHIAWARSFFAATEPFSNGGAYVNHLEAGAEGAARIHEAYGQNYDRLVALKNKYDPTNFFHRNQNIRPTV